MSFDKYNVVNGINGRENQKTNWRQLKERQDGNGNPMIKNLFLGK